jgi:acyl-CoA synthetase (AMP-forming)/AMP-acid ligase II
MLLTDLYHEGLANAPDRPALIVDDTICTYRELHEVSQQWAQALLRWGVRRGDRIPLLMGNTTEYLQLYFACCRVGAIVSPMSCVHQTASDELAFALNLTGSRLLIVSSDYYPQAKDLGQRTPALEKVFVIDDIAADDLSWKRFARHPSTNVPWPEVKESDAALIIFTSGSTDRPKGVTHTHHSILHGAITKSTALRLDDRDVILVATLLCHVSGSFGFSLPPMLRGGTAAFMANPSTAGLLDLIEKRRPTHVATGPAQVRDVIAHPRSRHTDFSCIKTQGHRRARPAATGLK